MKFLVLVLFEIFPRLWLHLERFFLYPNMFGSIELKLITTYIFLCKIKGPEWTNQTLAVERVRKGVFTWLQSLTTPLDIHD